MEKSGHMRKNTAIMKSNYLIGIFHIHHGIIMVFYQVQKISISVIYYIKLTHFEKKKKKKNSFIYIYIYIYVYIYK